MNRTKVTSPERLIHNFIRFSLESKDYKESSWVEQSDTSDVLYGTLLFNKNKNDPAQNYATSTIPLLFRPDLIFSLNKGDDSLGQDRWSRLSTLCAEGGCELGYANPHININRYLPEPYLETLVTRALYEVGKGEILTFGGDEYCADQLVCYAANRESARKYYQLLETIFGLSLGAPSRGLEKPAIECYQDFALNKPSGHDKRDNMSFGGLYLQALNDRFPRLLVAPKDHAIVWCPTLKLLNIGGLK